MAKRYFIKKYDKIIANYTNYEITVYHASLLDAEIIEVDEK